MPGPGDPGLRGGGPALSELMGLLMVPERQTGVLAVLGTTEWATSSPRGQGGDSDSGTGMHDSQWASVHRWGLNRWDPDSVRPGPAGGPGHFLHEEQSGRPPSTLVPGGWDFCPP